MTGMSIVLIFSDTEMCIERLERCVGPFKTGDDAWEWVRVNGGDYCDVVALEAQND